MSRTVLITGAAGHLGKAVAAHFAGQGARLTLLDRQQAALAAAYPEKGDRLLLAADLLDSAQTDAAIAAAVERFGRIDVLCHLAGGFRLGQSVHATSDADWDFLFDINTRTLRYFSDDSVGFKYPDSYNALFGSDYEPPEYIREAHSEARNHR